MSVRKKRLISIYSSTVYNPPPQPITEGSQDLRRDLSAGLLALPHSIAS